MCNVTNYNCKHCNQVRQPADDQEQKTKKFLMQASELILVSFLLLIMGNNYSIK